MTERWVLVERREQSPTGPDQARRGKSYHVADSCIVFANWRDRAGHSYSQHDRLV